MKREIPIERLRELVRLDPASGRLIWIARASIKAPTWPGQECGCITRTGYRQARIDGVTILSHRAAFALHHGRWPTGMLDHINGVRDDNRPCNLREATPIQNGQNKAMTPLNTSGSRGVTFEGGKWRARIRVDGKKVHLGQFDDKADATRAYQSAAAKFHGAFARGVTA